MKHGVPQQPIRFGLITAAAGFKPSDDVGIQTHSYRLLLWPIELADIGSAPIQNRGRVGKINILVSFGGDGAGVIAYGSSKTRIAVSKRTLCLRRF
jgi:hypothetical protein